jgi:hypothetical protein
MSTIRAILKTAYISISAGLLLTLFSPVYAVIYADNTCTPPSSAQPGVHWPTGSDASTFTYQCTGPYAGDWTNQYYVFNPSDDSRTPLFSPDYSYNCSTGIWYMSEYDYSVSTGTYILNRVQTTDPGLPTGCQASDTSTSDPATANNASSPSTGPTSNDPSSQTSSLVSGAPINPTSSSTNNTSISNNVGLNSTTQASMNNTVASNSSSGDAVVVGNTTAGNAASGASQSEANIINMLQSSSNILGSGKPVVTFTANINGNVNGNLLINPAVLGSVQNSNTNLNNNVTVNNSTGAAINNNIDLASSSGNASVTANTSGGNATSGAAETIANVVNAINSAIVAGKSFIGTININGNLNGNIVIPPDFVNQLLADNVPTVTLSAPGSTNEGSVSVNNNATVNNTNNLGINNNVTTNATSGTASVIDNTKGGSATSGNASNSITAFNLTGSNVIGANDLLVFVNVTGNWVGLILNAPPGTTAAEIGGGITNTSVNNNASLNNKVNEQINNNINDSAKSGNAAVSYNTKGGNATSGNADNAVNLLNMENSSFNLSGWFGLLFINVFGTWNGNFGISPEIASIAASGTNGTTAPTASGGPLAVFSFVPSSKTSTTGSGAGSSAGSSYFFVPMLFSDTGSTSGQSSYYPPSVLAAANDNKKINQPALQNLPRRNMARTAEIIGGAVVLYIAIDFLYSYRRTIFSYIKTR